MSVKKLKMSNEGAMLVTWRIRWRRIWKWAVFLMLRRESIPVASVPRIFEHAPIVVITVLEPIEYWVTSLEALTGPLNW